MNAINNNAAPGVSAGTRLATSRAVDFDAFAFNRVLDRTFPDTVKKPELDDDANAQSNAAVAITSARGASLE